MTTIYANSEEKFLKAVVTYPIEVDEQNQLFYDREGTKPVYVDEGLDLWMKGLLCIDMGDGFYARPFFGTFSGGVFGCSFVLIGSGAEQHDFICIARPSEEEDENELVR